MGNYVVFRVVIHYENTQLLRKLHSSGKCCCNPLQGVRQKLHDQQQRFPLLTAAGGVAPPGTEAEPVRACPVQGGFAVVRPSVEVFDELVAVVSTPPVCMRW